MKNTLRALALLGSGLVLTSFVVVVVNQTAQVVELAGHIHPWVGTATFWGLLSAYGVMIGAPAVMLWRMPRPLRPPEQDSGPEFDAHLAKLAQRLGVGAVASKADGPGVDRQVIEDALESRDADADVLIRQMATTVFLTTAVSQSGRLDAILVLSAQSRMVWRIAHLYYQRPSLRELAHLYANVAATSFSAGELDDLELHQIIQPLAAGSVGEVGGAIPGLQIFTSILVNSLLSGSANAFLTLRVGIISKNYCSSLVAAPRGRLRKVATAQAARLLTGIVRESGARLREAIWSELKLKMPRPWANGRRQPETV